jgi:undecaprenyl-diphosphatase
MEEGPRQAVTSFAPDQAAAEWFLTRSLDHPRLVDVGEVLAVVLHPWVFRTAVVAAGVLAWRAGHRHAAVVAVTTMAAGSLLGAGLKVLLRRPRPAWADPVAAEGGYSMPSGHALNATMGCALLLVLAWPWLRRRERAAAVAAAVVVAGVTSLDRMLLGVHYPSDVAVGAGLGTALAATAAIRTRRGRRSTAGAEAPRGHESALSR